MFNGYIIKDWILFFITTVNKKFNFDNTFYNMFVGDNVKITIVILIKETCADCLLSFGIFTKKTNGCITKLFK